MLDKEIDFIFMNTLTQYTESLANAINKALKGKSGNIEYEIGGAVRKGYFQKIPSMDWWMVMAKKEGTDATIAPKLDISLQIFNPELQNQLNEIDNRVTKLLLETQGKWDKEPDIRRFLNIAMGAYTPVVEAVYVDLKGIMKYIEPREYKSFEGTNISKQQHQIDLLKTHKPIFSTGFRVVEGFLAVVLAYPLFDSNNQLQASVNLVVRPELIMQKLVKSLNIPDDTELWIMQKDGMIIYDDDPDEIGRMLFTDPLYAPYQSLKDLGRQISSSPSGKGEYWFQAVGGTEKVLKVAMWDTVSLHGREWRVILAKRVN